MNRREFIKLSAASPLFAAGAIKEMRAESKAVQDAKMAIPARDISIFCIVFIFFVLPR